MENRALTARFEMLALGKVEVSGVEYGPGDRFWVVGIDTVRRLEAWKAAVSASNAPDTTAAVAPSGSVEGPTTAGDSVDRGIQNGNSKVARPRAPRRKP